MAIGDLVIATPAIRRLREGLKGAEIDLLTTTWTAPAALGNPHIDHIEVVSLALFFSPGYATLLSTLKLIRRLRRKRYDLAVIFHKHRAIERFVRMLGISRRYYFNDGQSGNTILLDESRHSAITAWGLADLALEDNGVDGTPTPRLNELCYEWFVLPDEAEQADIVLHDSQLKEGDYAVLLPGGGVNPRVDNRVKRWSADKFADLANELMNQHGLKIVLLGGESDNDAALTVEGNNSAPDLVNLCGKVDLRISAAIMQKAGIVVCNDSGPLHIAAAVGAPVVGIFGPTGFRHKLPPGENVSAACLDLPCSPCYFGIFKGCIFDNIRCMDELTVEEVSEVVNRVLLLSKSVVKS